MAVIDKPKSVRALQRGLIILDQLGFSEGRSTAEVAQRLSLPRATVLRLLETLEGLGYVARDKSDGRFRLTHQAANLGDGFDAGVIVGTASGPVLAELGNNIKWPADVFSFENGAMIIQESTNARSPLSVEPNLIGARRPVLRSAAGRAFLASCNQEQREIIVRCLRRMDDPAERPFLAEGVPERIIRQTTERGYAVRDGREDNRKTSSIGIAIIQDGRAFGSISVRWLNSVLEFSQAVDQLLPSVEQAAQRIAQNIRRIITA